MRYIVIPIQTYKERPHSSLYYKISGNANCYYIFSSISDLSTFSHSVYRRHPILFARDNCKYTRKRQLNNGNTAGCYIMSWMAVVELHRSVLT